MYQTSEDCSRPVRKLATAHNSDKLRLINHIPLTVAFGA